MSHLFLLHNFLPSTFFGICPAFWSLAVEFQLYLLYPALLWLRQRWGMRGALFFTLTLEIFMRLFAGVFELRHETKWQYVLYYSPLILWFSWSLGAYLAEKYNRRERIFPAKSSAALLITGCVLFALFTFFRPLDFLSFTTASLLSLIAVEMYLWSNRALNRLERRLVPLGLCSYSVYLWHQPLMPVLRGIMQRLGLPASPGAALLVCAPIAFLIIWAWGWALYRTVETWSAGIARRSTAQK